MLLIRSIIVTVRETSYSAAGYFSRHLRWQREHELAYMGLFDKIKDNAKNISMKAIDAASEYTDDLESGANEVIQPVVSADAGNGAAVAIESAEVVAVEEEKVEVEETKVEATPVKKEVEDKESRRSKVTEVSKADHEKAEKEKRQEKAKQAAKERLAKSFVPSYKKDIKVKDGPKDAKSKTTAKKTIGIVDISPHKFQSTVKGAGYARERAALSALASQRKLNGTVPLYTASHMNFRTRVFINRIEYSGSFGKSVLPIEQVTWVKLRAGGTGVIVETTENKRVVMVVKPTDRLAFTNAVLRVQALLPKKGKFKDTQTVRIDELEKFNDGIDEIEKLAKLYDKGILSQEEFDAKKKQILGL